MTVMDLDAAYTLVIALASISVLIGSVELIIIRAEFEDSGLFGWAVLRTLSKFSLTVGADRVQRLISHRLFVPLIAGGRASAALALIFLGDRLTLSAACVLFIVAATVLLYWRSPVGLDGSDQMTLIIFIAVGIHKIFHGDVLVAKASLWFIAIQGCLSYFVAGVAKLISPVWRSGEAVRRIFSTRTYGASAVAHVLQRSDGVAVALAWLVIIFECTFPLALVLGKQGFVVFAALGVVFHLANAVVMGLNTFVWAFAASYPAILFCAASLK